MCSPEKLKERPAEHERKIMLRSAKMTRYIGRVLIRHCISGRHACDIQFQSSDQTDAAQRNPRHHSFAKPAIVTSNSCSRQPTGLFRFSSFVGLSAIRKLPYYGNPEVSTSTIRRADQILVVEQGQIILPKISDPVCTLMKTGAPHVAVQMCTA